MPIAAPVQRNSAAAQARRASPDGAAAVIACSKRVSTAVARLAGLFLLLCSMAAVPAPAADYPRRPVTVIVAFTPGGPSDVLARILGRKLEQLLGQPFVIDNRPGAGGNIAAELAARAAPDGYTLLMGNNRILATNASLYKKIGFEPETDFAPIVLIGSQANILVVNPALPARSMAELIALAKAEPGQLNLPPPATARPRIWPANCSRPRPASTSCMSPTRAQRRHCRT